MPPLVNLGPGTILAGQFEVIRALGAGGMGEVYEARQLGLGRLVAIKTLAPEHCRDPSLLARFAREARTAAMLQHPNIVATTGFFTPPGEPPFIVMEHASGRSLRELLEQETRIPWQRACAIAIQALDALKAAHALDIVHRDLKPGNLLVSSTAFAPDFVRLLDFGIAKVIDEDRFTRMTMTGVILGTPGYMAPEQARGAHVDGRTDLYAVGVLLFRMIAGRLPYDAPSGAMLLAAVVQDPPLLLETVAHVPPALAAIVACALRKPLHERFASAHEMQSALVAVLEAERRAATPAPTISAITPTAMAATSVAVPIARVERRSRVPLLVFAAVAFAALSIGAAFAVGAMSRPAPPLATSTAPLLSGPGTSFEEPEAGQRPIFEPPKPAPVVLEEAPKPPVILAAAVPPAAAESDQGSGPHATPERRAARRPTPARAAGTSVVEPGDRTRETSAGPDEPAGRTALLSGFRWIGNEQPEVEAAIRPLTAAVGRCAAGLTTGAIRLNVTLGSVGGIAGAHCPSHPEINDCIDRTYRRAHLDFVRGGFFNVDYELR